jgi:hypothetical protein
MFFDAAQHVLEETKGWRGNRAMSLAAQEGRSQSQGQSPKVLKSDQRAASRKILAVKIYESMAMLLTIAIDHETDCCNQNPPALSESGYSANRAQRMRGW